MKSIEKASLGFVEGMEYGRSISSENFKQIDWEKAKEIIEDNKGNISSVTAGLAEDWNYTSGEVWNSEDGYIKKENTYVYASSNWATPALEIEYKDGKEETVECWTNGDDSGSYFDSMI